MRSILRSIDKYLGLTSALLWVLRAVTSVALVFRGEIDDASLHGPSLARAPPALDSAVAELAPKLPRSNLAYTAASEGSRNRFNLLFTNNAVRTNAIRVAVSGSFSAGVDKWHRAFGLLWAHPATFLVSLGVLQARSTDQWLRAHLRIPKIRALTQAHFVPIGTALTTAFRPYPAATTSLIATPSADRPWY